MKRHIAQSMKDEAASFLVAWFGWPLAAHRLVAAKKAMAEPGFQEVVFAMGFVGETTHDNLPHVMQQREGMRRIALLLEALSGMDEKELRALVEGEEETKT